MHSCIYDGRVKHSRTQPAVHEFSYRLFMMYLDLDELPTLFRKRWFWSTSRPALARFRRSDHLGAEDQPLAESVRKLVEKETGQRPGGPIRLLTNLAYFGYCFNPVSFYYCFAEDGQTVEFIVAEVNNTPWGERDTYVMDCRNKDMTSVSWRFQPVKKMHVSPFMPMELEYNWVLSAPTEQLSVFMANARNGKRFFGATLNLKKTPISGASLARILFRFPFMTARIMLAIYWQALRLWIKRCPVYKHPNKETKVTAR
jgi:hypothetical protein